MENVRFVRKRDKGVLFKEVKMKKLLGIILLSTMVILSGCNGNTQNDDEISIVAASFHEYDWAREILGEKAEDVNLTLLIDNGVDLHSYEPSVEDIALISSADIFIHNGGASDNWVDDVFEQESSSEVKELNIMEMLGDAVKDEVLVEGMEHGNHGHDHDDDAECCEEHDHDHDAECEEHDHDHDAECEEHDHDHDAECEDHDHDEHEGGHSDEHIWLSLKNAVIACEILTEEISNLDPDNKSVYEKNAEAYINSLKELDGEYESMVSEASRDTVIFADRFPFLYMMNDYDIEYYAAFAGCSAETEASFETVAFLSEKADELDVNYVLILENGLEEMAQTVINNADNKKSEILTINSIQSVSSGEIEDGVTYYSIMEDNLNVLKKALAE